MRVQKKVPKEKGTRSSGRLASDTVVAVSDPNRLPCVARVSPRSPNALSLRQWLAFSAKLCATRRTQRGKSQRSRHRICMASTDNRTKNFASFRPVEAVPRELKKGSDTSTTVSDTLLNRRFAPDGRSGAFFFGYFLMGTQKKVPRIGRGENYITNS